MSKLQLHNFLSLYMYQSQNLIKKKPQKRGKRTVMDFIRISSIVYCSFYFVLVKSFHRAQKQNAGGKCIDLLS